MTDKLFETMKEEIKKLPKENQVAIESFDWGEKVEEISKKYNLTEDEVNDVQTETGIFLLGLCDYDLFILNLEDVVLIESTANGLAREIFENIFTPIAEMIEASIRGGLKNQIVRWDQSVNFVVSGGDYSNFIYRPKN